MAFSTKRAFFPLFIMVLLCLSKTALAGAANIAATPCDPKYYDSLKSRAWLEAQREIMQNENLIVKPDSVLEYTCFEKFAGILAQHAEDMFSENTRWGTILSPTHMDTALQNLIGGALSNYISTNFNHTSLGGRGTFANNNSPTISPIQGSAYTCTVMRDVWQEAKCLDFIDEPAQDGFYAFDYYASNDIRKLPQACSTGVGSRFTSEQDLAVGATTPWDEDAAVSYYSLLDPAQCGNNSLQIATGITVQRRQAPTQYQEKVCIAPGCHYEPTGANSGNCSNAAPNNSSGGGGGATP